MGNFTEDDYWEDEYADSVSHRKNFCHRIKAVNFNAAINAGLGPLFSHEYVHKRWVITDVSLSYSGPVGVQLSLQIMSNINGIGVYWFPVIETVIANDNHKWSGLHLPMQTKGPIPRASAPVIMNCVGYGATDDIYMTLSGWVED